MLPHGHAQRMWSASRVRTPTLGKGPPVSLAGPHQRPYVLHLPPSLLSTTLGYLPRLEPLGLLTLLRDAL